MVQQLELLLPRMLIVMILPTVLQPETMMGFLPLMQVLEKLPLLMILKSTLKQPPATT